MSCGFVLVAKSAKESATRIAKRRNLRFVPTRLWLRMLVTWAIICGGILELIQPGDFSSKCQ